MEVLKSSCSVLRSIPAARLPPQAKAASAGESKHLKFEVSYRIAVCRDPDGDGLTEHLDLSTIVRSGGPFADRQSVEIEAARQLPSMLREIADELETKELAVSVMSAV